MLRGIQQGGRIGGSIKIRSTTLGSVMKETIFICAPQVHRRGSTSGSPESRPGPTPWSCMPAQLDQVENRDRRPQLPSQEEISENFYL